MAGQAAAVSFARSCASLTTETWSTLPLPSIGTVAMKAAVREQGPDVPTKIDLASQPRRLAQGGYAQERS